MSSLLLWTGNTFDIGDTRITYGSIPMLGLFGVAAYVLGSTAWGKHVYSTGDDLESARLAGVRTTACCSACTCWPAWSARSPAGS